MAPAKKNKKEKRIRDQNNAAVKAFRQKNSAKMQQAREEFDKVKEANMESKIRFEIKDGEIVRLEEEALNLMKTSPSSETAKLREEVLSIREARQSRAQDGEQNH